MMGKSICVIEFKKIIESKAGLLATGTLRDPYPYRAFGRVLVYLKGTRQTNRVRVQETVAKRGRRVHRRTRPNSCVVQETEFC